MSGYKKKIYAGKIRMFVSNTGDSEFNPFEVHDYEAITDRLISDVTNTESADIANEELNLGAIEYSFEDEFREIFKNYSDGATLEIYGDMWIEHSKYWTDCGYEYDSNCWLENTKHRQLTPEQVERFCTDESEEAIKDIGIVSPVKISNSAAD